MVALSLGQNGLMHGGHRGVPGRLPCFHPLKEGGHVETWGTHHTGTSRERRKHRTNEAVDVKEWHHVQASILRSQGKGHLNVVSGCAKVRMCEGNYFRP